MSKTQAFAGKLKSPHGSASWSVVGTDSTEVPISAANAIGTGYAVGQATKGLLNRQNNEAATSAAKIKANATPITPTLTPEGVIIPPVFPPQQ